MKAIALISCVLAAMSVTARAQHNINTCIERATTNVVCGSVANPGEITNTVFCVEQGADLPYPEFIREPTYNNGRITITKTHSDCSTTTTNIDVTYTTSFFGFSPAPPNTSRLGVYTSLCHVLGLSSHPNYCPHIRINYGNVTWHIVPTNCVELGIIFADASGWKVVKVDFIGGAGSVVLQYDGFTVTYEAKIKVLCQCGCSFSEKIELVSFLKLMLHPMTTLQAGQLAICQPSQFLFPGAFMKPLAS